MDENLFLMILQIKEAKSMFLDEIVEDFIILNREEWPFRVPPPRLSTSCTHPFQVPALPLSDKMFYFCMTG